MFLSLLFFKIASYANLKFFKNFFKKAKLQKKKKKKRYIYYKINIKETKWL